MKKFWKWAGGLFLVAVVVVACSAAVSGGAKPAATTTPLATGGGIPVATASVSPPVVVPVDTSTVSQRAAVRKAQSYIDGQAFSKKGLIRQLTSQFEGYAKADVDYALAHITVDWMAEAAEKSASYMQIMGYSKSGLINQLTSSAEGFTKAEAEFGAKSVGL